MIQNSTDVTEARKYRPDRALNEPEVTPISEQELMSEKVRDDISAILKKQIQKTQDTFEKTTIHSERNFLIVDTDIPLPREGLQAFDSDDDINEDRITLLARKYANKQMLPEDNARLNILTQRLVNAVPSITENDLEILEGLKEQAESANSLHKKIQEKIKEWK